MIKRVFDIFGSLLGLIIFSPALIIISILIKIFMPGPILFRQRRSGQHGKIFTIFKFRTMIVNHGGSTISIRGEKRITPVGTFLRNHKLDELPELLNVLKGDMSLVGPRPDVPEYTSKLCGDERKIIELRPGLTGPASLKYASEEVLLASVEDPLKYNDNVIWPDKVKINLEYYYNNTFIGDIRIMLKTIFRKF